MSIIKTAIKGCFLSIPCLGKYPHICPNHKIPPQERRAVKVRKFLASLAYDLQHSFFLLPHVTNHTLGSTCLCAHTQIHIIGPTSHILLIPLPATHSITFCRLGRFGIQHKSLSIKTHQNYSEQANHAVSSKIGDQQPSPDQATFRQAQLQGAP